MIPKVTIQNPGASPSRNAAPASLIPKIPAKAPMPARITVIPVSALHQAGSTPRRCPLHPMLRPALVEAQRAHLDRGRPSAWHSADSLPPLQPAQNALHGQFKGQGQFRPANGISSLEQDRKFRFHALRDGHFKRIVAQRRPITIRQHHQALPTATMPPKSLSGFHDPHEGTSLYRYARTVIKEKSAGTWLGHKAQLPRDVAQRCRAHAAQEEWPGHRMRLLDPQPLIVMCNSGASTGQSSEKPSNRWNGSRWLASRQRQKFVSPRSSSTAIASARLLNSPPSPIVTQQPPPRVRHQDVERLLNRGGASQTSACGRIIRDLRGNAQVCAKADPLACHGLIGRIEQSGLHLLRSGRAERPYSRGDTLGVGRDDGGGRQRAATRVDCESDARAGNWRLAIDHTDGQWQHKRLTRHGFLAIPPGIEQRSQLRQRREKRPAILYDREARSVLVQNGQLTVVVIDTQGRLRIGEGPLDIAGGRARRDQPIIAGIVEAVFEEDLTPSSRTNQPSLTVKSCSTTVSPSESQRRTLG